MIQFDALRCTICLVEYDLDNHIPRILPKCGHTVCSECLTKILEMPKPSCPLDKCSFKKKLTQVFPVNFTVRHILEETSEKDLCPVHQKPLKFLCPEKEKKLCKRCVEFLDYQNHAILKPISQVKVEGDKKREILEHRLSSLEAFEMDIRLVLEEKRVQLAKKIEEGFEDLFSMMMLKKSCMLFEVDCMFEREINKLRYVVGENSPARKNITEQLEDLKHMISKKDFFSISQFELSEGSVAFDGRSLKEQAEGFKEEMEGYLGLFGNYFQSIEDIISNFDLSRQNWIESFKIGGHSESSEDQEVAIESSCPFEILSSLQIYPNSQGYLEIVSKELQPTALLIDMEQWKTMTGVWLQLKQPFLSSQNLKILALILSKMEKINSIWVTVENQQNICEDDLMYILPVLFARTGDLEQISISFNYSAIGDRTVVFIAERILPRVKKLNSFELCLGATYITNRAVKALSRSILPYADKLNTFRIEIGRNNVSEDVVGDLFVRMPNVKNFMLGVSALNFSDRAAELFIKNTLSSMESLEILSLWMQNTTITDQSVIQLFSNIKSVKVLQTSFENTLISDKSMDVLEKSEVMKLKGLKCFDLNLNGTWVTDPIKTHIFQLKDKAYGDPQRWMGVEV